MSKSQRKTAPEDISINLTPMIDVVFLLVIFFMVGSKFSESESRISVSVPTVGPVSAAAQTPDERVVEVIDDGRLLLDGQPVTPEQMMETLRSLVQGYPDLSVVVRANSDRSLQSFADAVHRVRASGVEKIGMAVKSDPAGGGFRR
ncbi:MAG: biopolymer transporter ExbD [Planctomycetota bacterium]